MSRRALLLGLVVASGCVDAGDDRPLGSLGLPGPFDEVGDFPTEGCDPDVALEGADLEGIWHLDVTYDGGYQGVVVLRLDGDGHGALDGLLGGHHADARADGALLARRVTTRGDGTRQVAAAMACRARADGGLDGFHAVCEGDDCFLGFARFYPVPVLDEPEASGLALVGEIGPDAAGWPREDVTVNVQRRGTTAYVVRYGDGLRIVDLSDPSAPAELGHAEVALPDEEIWNDVKLREGPGGEVFALVASSRRGVVVLDVSDPAAPVEVTSFPPAPTNVHTLALDGDRAYLADVSLGGLRIYDVADPAAPVELARHTDAAAERGAFVHDLFAAAGTIYLCYWNLGLVALDAGDPPGTAPIEIGRFDAYDRRTSHSAWPTEAGGRPIVLHGDEDWGAHLRVLDGARGDGFLDVLAEYRTRPQVSIHNVMAVGDLALVTYYQDGLRLLDLADPTSPVEVGHYLSWPGPKPGYGTSFYEGAIGVDVDPDRGLILLADTARGLLVLEPDADLALGRPRP
jgi:hypothetical protein